MTRGVRDYVMDNEKAVEFLKKLVDMVEFLIPNYIAEGKDSACDCDPAVPEANTGQ